MQHDANIMACQSTWSCRAAGTLGGGGEVGTGRRRAQSSIHPRAITSFGSRRVTARSAATHMRCTASTGADVTDDDTDDDTDNGRDAIDDGPVPVPAEVAGATATAATAVAVAENMRCPTRCAAAPSRRMTRNAYSSRVSRSSTF